MIAHRGASGHRPENTLAAYELAVEQRADCIEIDLHRTKDGHCVVTHDETLVGIGGRGEIADVSFADLMGLARQRDEVCIGVKVRALESDTSQNCGVTLIPEKNTRFALSRDDCLIVLAEDEL